MPFSSNLIIEQDNFLVEEMISQEGLPFVVKNFSDLVIENPAIYLLSDKGCNSKKISVVKHILSKRGVVICDKRTYSFLKPHVNTSEFKNIRTDQAMLLNLEFSYNDYLNDFSIISKLFKYQKLELMERVAFRKKKNVRNTLCNLIKNVLFAHGLPFVHKWYYPKGYESIFSFKIDVDEYNEQDISSLIHDSDGQIDGMTWFICCSVFENNDKLLRSIIDKNFDIQSHGYFHHVYNTLKENKINIKKSKDFLDSYGLNVSGFSAPMGKWNKPVYNALYDLAFRYSSDFGFDYDNLPSFPIQKECSLDLLQIPVHPICLGSFLERGSQRYALDYFISLIDFKYRNKQPIILYGHPTRRLGRYGDFFKGIIEKATGLSSIKKMTFTDIDAWWRKRRSFRFLVEAFTGNRLIINNRSDDFAYRVEIEGNKEAFVSAQDKEIAFSCLQFKKFDSKRAFYDESILKDSFKMRISNLLDWEEVTPLDYIDKSCVSGQIKYSARVFKAVTK